MKHRRILASWTAVASISLVSYGVMAAVKTSPHPGRLPDPVVELPTLRIWAAQGESLLGVKFKHPLAAAIIANDIPKLKAGLKAHQGKPLPTLEGGYSLVQLACELSRSDCLKLLIEHGAQVNQQGGGPWKPTPLIDATSVKCHECIKLLLTHGADPNGLSGEQSNHLKMSPLANAAAVNDSMAIKMLIDAGALVNGPPDTTPPLIMAAIRCNSEAATSLLSHGADPNAAGPKDRITPMTACASGACPSIMSQLLSHGADPHGALNHGQTPLIQAAWWGSPQCVELLLKHDPDLLAMDHFGHDATMMACMRGHADVLKLLIKAGADVNRANSRGWTPLMFAARHGAEACVQILIEHDADLNANADGWTPLKEAAVKCHPAIVAKLGAAGANIGYRDRSGYTAMDNAAASGCLECLKFLIEAASPTQSERDRARKDIERVLSHDHISKAQKARLTACLALLDGHAKSDTENP